NRCIDRHVCWYSTRPSHFNRGERRVPPHASSGEARSVAAMSAYITSRRQGNDRGAPRASSAFTPRSSCRISNLLRGQQDTSVVALERPLSPIARAHERPRHALEKTERERLLAITLELLRRHPALNGQMIGRWTQVLPEGQDIDTRRANIAHGFIDLLIGLAESEHEARLGENVGTMLLRMRQHIERLLVAGSGIAHGMREATHRLNVLRKDIDAAIDHDFDMRMITLEVRGQRFHRRLRTKPLDLAHAGCEM